MYFVDRNVNAAVAASEFVAAGKCFSDFREVVDRVDGAIIAVPHSLHFEITLEFLRKGRHVLCEKPLSEKPEDILTLNSESGKHGGKLCVNNTRRAFPSFSKAKEMIDAGEIGEILSIRYMEANRFAWQSDTDFYVNPTVSDKGVLLDIGAHAIDLICWWLNKEPRLIEYADDSCGGPESLVKLTAQSDNSQVFLLLNRLLELGSRFRISGTDGKIEGVLGEWKTLMLTKGNAESAIVTAKTRFKQFSDIADSIISNFIQTIMGNAEPIVTGEDVFPSIHFIDLCYQARAQKQDTVCT